MDASESRVVLVTGATGRQGGAVTRHLLNAGWTVRALTRNPASTKAQRLKALGAEVAQGDLDDFASLRTALEGVYGVFSLQNPSICGADGELRQGKTIADAAKQAEIQHFVYASAGPGTPETGVLQWDNKLEIEEHIRRLELPVTVLRPMALMELMTDQRFYPAASTWHVMPKLAGGATPIPWINADDIGAISALVYEAPDQYVGRELRLASDVKSVDECRAIYRSIAGRNPRHFPMPVWLMGRFAGSDVIQMWRWLQTGTVAVDPAETRALLPGARTVEDWLRMQLA